MLLGRNSSHLYTSGDCQETYKVCFLGFFEAILQYNDRMMRSCYCGNSMHASGRMTVASGPGVLSCIQLQPHCTVLLHIVCRWELESAEAQWQLQHQKNGPGVVLESFTLGWLNLFIQVVVYSCHLWCGYPVSLPSVSSYSRVTIASTAWRN